MKSIIVNNLSKTYSGGTKALDNVSFTLDEGEVFGFLGPNGAGKTTAVKILTGMLSPTEGSSHVLGIDPAFHPEQVHKLAGVVTEHAQMYDNLSGLQNLIFYGTVFGLTQEQSKKRGQEMLDILGLIDDKDKKLSAYSTGMRQRLSLARAMLHSPKILFLDEPTSGLDPESVQSVNNLIKHLSTDKGTTIFLCTHQLRYAQEICTGYGLIDQGTMLAVGDIDHIRSMVFSSMTATIKADKYPDNLAVKSADDGSCEINVQSEDDLPLIVKSIVDAGGKVYHVSARKPSLEEIYFALIEQRDEKKGEAKC